jgi:hypothetical protein
MSIYTISDLLENQPKKFKKLEGFSILINYYNGSPELKKLGFDEICLRVLNRAKVKPENLRTFYKTHNLPKNPFFPMFLKLRREYLDSLRKHVREMRGKIKEKWKRLPKRSLRFIKKLKEIEKEYNVCKRYPFWRKNIVPNTEKRMDEYIRFSKADWVNFFIEYLKNFIENYKLGKKINAEKLTACFILGISENSISLSSVNKHYYRLCKIYHPDKGGESEDFLKVKWARDCLKKDLKQD